MDAKRPLALEMVRLRRQIRALCLARGFGWWLGAALGLGFVLIGLDWLAHLPLGVRVFLGIAWMFLMGGLTWRLLLRPGLRRVGLWEVAAAVDRLLPNTQDRMVTGIDVLELELTTESPLAAHVLNEAEARLVAIAPGRLLNRGRAMRPLGLGIGCVALAASAAMTAPEWVRTGLARYIHPGGPAAWPRWTSIVPLTGDLVVAAGEPVEVAMRLERGDRPGRPAWLVRENGRGEQIREEMLRGPEGRFGLQLAAVNEPLRYWFVAGDDSTASRPGRIKVFVRPEVTRARLEVSPPAHMQRPAYTLTLDDRRAEVPAGSHLRATFWVSNPVRVRPDGSGPAARAVGLPSEQPHEVTFADNARDRLMLSAEVRETVRFRLELSDQNGLGLGDEHPYTITAVPDELPTVRLFDPPSPRLLTPRGTLEVVVEAQDDVGLASLKWVAQRSGGSEVAADWSQALPAIVPNQRHQVRVSRQWSPAELGVREGETVNCWAEATDNFMLAGERHPAVRSQRLELRIVGPEEVARRLESEAAALQRGLRQLLQTQEALYRRTRTASSLGTATSPAESARIAAEQAELVKRMRALSRGFERLLKEAGDNHISADVPQLLRRLLGERQEAANIAEQPMLQASELARSGYLGESLRHQESALSRMRAMLNRWGEQTALRELAQGAQELLTRQQELTRQTGLLPMGADDQRDNSVDRQRARLAHAQRELAADAERQLQTGRRTDQEEDATSHAEASQDPGQQVPEEMRTAATAVRSGQKAAAQSAQRSAEQGLQKLLEKLAPDRKRELTELGKKAREAEARIRELIAEQARLLGEVAAAETRRDAAALEELREPQSILRARTQVSIAPVSQADPSGRAADLLNASVLQMTAAAAALAEADGAAAKASGEEALQGLTTALAVLTELRQESERKLAALTMQELRNKLAAVRSEQARINSATGEIDARRGPAASAPASGSTLSEADSRNLVLLSAAQGRLANRLKSMQPELAEVVVSGWMVSNLSDRMARIASGLEQRLSGRELRGEQKSVLARLDLLLQTLAEEPGEEGYEQGSSEANAQDTGKPPPVPKMAELKLLRGLQAELLERTREAPGLEEVRRLGSEQTELRELAGKLLGEGAQ